MGEVEGLMGEELVSGWRWWIAESQWRLMDGLMCGK